MVTGGGGALINQNRSSMEGAEKKSTGTGSSRGNVIEWYMSLVLPARRQTLFQRGCDVL